MNDACELDIGEWRQHVHYTCDRCNIRTTNYDVAVSRCQAATTEPQLTSAAGLLGPTGEPLPPPDDDESEGETPPDGEFLTHDQQ